MISYLKYLSLTLIFFVLTMEVKATETISDTVKTPHVIARDYVSDFAVAVVECIQNESIEGLTPYLTDSVIIVFHYSGEVKTNIVTANEAIKGLRYLLSQMPPSKIELFQSEEEFPVITLKLTSNNNLIKPLIIVFCLDKGKANKIILK